MFSVQEIVGSPPSSGRSTAMMTLGALAYSRRPAMIRTLASAERLHNCGSLLWLMSKATTLFLCAIYMTSSVKTGSLSTSIRSMWVAWPLRIFSNTVSRSVFMPLNFLPLVKSNRHPLLVKCSPIAAV